MSAPADAATAATAAPPPVNQAAQAAQASAMAMAAAQTDPAALDPYGPGDQTAAHVLRPVLVTCIVLIALNTLFLALRFFSVLKLRKRRIPLAWDDWFLLLAYPWVIGVCAVALVMWHYDTVDGALAHEPVVQPWRLVPLLKSTIALAEIGLPAMILTRYSVLALYLRLFTDRFVRIASYCLVVLYSLYWVGFAIAGILQCRPVQYYWTRWNPMEHGVCSDDKFSRSGICGDRRSDRTYLRQQPGADNPSILTAANTRDFLLWMTLEPSLYFITACLPAMLPFFRLFVPSRMRRPARRPVGPMLSSNHSMRYDTTATSASERGFMRLRDDTGTITPQPSSSAYAGGRESKMSTSSVHELENTLQMDDLKRFANGEGIIMQTDVTVTLTTEERIEEILDMW
ncbi:MAG: hypothetical protein Q9162_003673 [Coniocarpon cinnabarinum]